VLIDFLLGASCGGCVGSRLVCIDVVSGWMVWGGNGGINKGCKKQVKGVGKQFNDFNRISIQYLWESVE